MPETLTELPKDIDAIIFTLGSDGQGRIGARAIDYGGVRNILRIFKGVPVRISLMTTIGVTERLSTGISALRFMTGKDVPSVWSGPAVIPIPSSGPAGLITTMMMSTES